MLRTLIYVLLLASLPGISAGSGTDNGTTITYKTSDDYEMVRESLEIAIIGQGLVISGTLHIQEMLDRTASDLGFNKRIYSAAESFEFCSSMISHIMTAADPGNITVCPFTVSVYQLISDPNHTYVAYRKPSLAGESDQAEKRILKLMNDISEEATE